MDKKNNNIKEVIENTYQLNELLSILGIKESIRGQFVGTCILALKNKFRYDGLSTEQIISGIRSLLDKFFNKSEILNILVNDKYIEKLESKQFVKILNYINNNIISFINEKSNESHDILSLFFTTFNKYVNKESKNQAFTPSHIIDFMCKVAHIDRSSVILDPTCGSGSFLVQAMVQAIKDCRTNEEREKILKSHVYGMEIEEKAFGLATTNMLIHGGDNSNIINCDCFEKQDWIRSLGINVVLMNPPYNAATSSMPKSFREKYPKSKEDVTKGFYFLNYIAETIKHGVLLCILPLSCAIGSKNQIIDQKKIILENNTLDAVFTYPSEVFFPGASVNTCCMVFKLGKPHQKYYQTFFGYYKDDGFIKKKNLGRIDINNKWENIEHEWLDLYNFRKEKPGLSVLHHVTADDEWLAEAYMKTDYSKLSRKDFEQSVRNFIAYKIKFGVKDSDHGNKNS